MFDLAVVQYRRSPSVFVSVSAKRFEFSPELRDYLASIVELEVVAVLSWTSLTTVQQKFTSVDLAAILKRFAQACCYFNKMIDD